MNKEKVLKGIECCSEFLCGECPYNKYEDANHMLKCNHILMLDIKEFVTAMEQPPAYVGQPIYRIKHNWGYRDSDILHENYTTLGYYVVEGKVSMIQQKADKSWKFRMSEGGSVSDHTMSDVGYYIFFDKEEAEKKAEERTNELPRV